MTGRAGPGYPLRLAEARLVLAWERLWPRLLPLLAVVGAFIVLALLNVFGAFPVWLHVGTLAIFAAAFVGAGWFAVGGLVWTNRVAARRRIEIDSGLRDRPLTALEDRLVGGDGDRRSAALWQAHRIRAAEAARRLRLALPRPAMARIDRFGLRAPLILALVVAVAAARHDPVERLRAALTPHFTVAMAEGPAVDAWITPPDYTRKAPMRLDAVAMDSGHAGLLDVPAGSIALVRVSGLDVAPELRVGSVRIAFEPLGDAVHRVETPIHDGDRLVITAGNEEIAAWRMIVVADQAPEITFARKPQAGDHGQLRLSYKTTDDYGVAKITATIGLDRGVLPEGALVTTEPDIGLSLPVPRTGTGRSSHDLTAHMWAGLPVRARLTATDAGGQTGQSDELTFILPQRPFRHPVARAIIAERRRLIDGTHTIRAAVAAGLAVIANRPATFDGDSVVFLALSVAHSRLVRDTRDSAVPSIRQLLWDTALRLEDGGLSVARRELDRLREQLAEALRDDVTPENVARLMDEVRRSLDHFLSALMNEAQRRGLMREPLQGEASQIARDDLQRMLDDIRQLAELGDMESARQRLADLQQMLETLRQMVERGRPSAEQAAKAKAMLDAMRDLTQRQQDLLDRSFDRNRPSTPEERQRNAEAAMGDAPDQEALRRRLGELMLDLDAMLGDIPGPLGEAERAMRGAVEDLLLGDNPGASESQGEALDALRRATRDAAQQAARGMGGFMMGQPPVPGQGRGRDPFGRSIGGTGNSEAGDVDIPASTRIRRAQEILRELRRRAGEPERPLPERDYIERLLERFRPGP